MTEAHEYEKTVLQQISDVAWLVRENTGKLGILNQDETQNYVYLSNDKMVSFDDKNEVVEHFGNIDLFNNFVTDDKEEEYTLYINGFAATYKDPITLDIDYENGLPMYTKIEGSDIYYVAGFYCVNYKKRWKIVDNPKLSTILKYEYVGPFKTAREGRAKLKELLKKEKA